MVRAGATCSSGSATRSFKLVIGGLTSIILVILGTVNLQFQGPFFPMHLWPVLRIVAASVMGRVWLLRS